MMTEMNVRLKDDSGVFSENVNTDTVDENDGLELVSESEDESSIMNGILCLDEVGEVDIGGFHGVLDVLVNESVE